MKEVLMSDEIAKVSQDKITPEARATQIAAHLEEFYREIFLHKLHTPFSVIYEAAFEYEQLGLDSAFNQFLTVVETVMGEMDLKTLLLSQEPIDLEVLDTMALAAEVNPLGIDVEDMILLLPMALSGFYCIKATHADRADKHDTAWSYVCDAERWRTVLHGLRLIVKVSKQHGKPYFSRKGKKGANSRQEKIKKVRNYAIKLYEEGNYSSPKKAAKEIKDSVIEYSWSQKGKNPYRIKEYSAEDTIYKWLLAYEKEKKSNGLICDQPPKVCE
jgi:hypothetical protein